MEPIRYKGACVDASRYDIKLPRFEDKATPTPVEKAFASKLPPNVWVITKDSPKSVRKAVWHLAYFFKREFRYDEPPYGHEGNDRDPDHVVLLFTEKDLAKGEDVYYAFGAVCFGKHSLEWAWFHPYERQRGHLSNVWPAIEDRFGPVFDVEGPCSKAMKSFLQKVRGATCLGRDYRIDTRGRS